MTSVIFHPLLEIQSVNPTLLLGCARLRCQLGCQEIPPGLPRNGRCQSYATVSACASEADKGNRDQQRQCCLKKGSANEWQWSSVSELTAVVQWFAGLFTPPLRSHYIIILIEGFDALLLIIFVVFYCFSLLRIWDGKDARQESRARQIFIYL